MKLVVDASVVAALYFPDERPPPEFVEQMTETETIAPYLFWYEIRATALKKERQRILAAAAVDEALRQIRDLPIVLRQMTDEVAVVGLARRHALSFYDASYLALALSERARLATLDSRLAAAARAEGVLLEP